MTHNDYLMGQFSICSNSTISTSLCINDKMELDLWDQGHCCRCYILKFYFQVNWAVCNSDE